MRTLVLAMVALIGHSVLVDRVAEASPRSAKSFRINIANGRGKPTGLPITGYTYDGRGKYTFTAGAGTRPNLVRFRMPKGKLTPAHKERETHQRAYYETSQLFGFGVVPNTHSAEVVKATRRPSGGTKRTGEIRRRGYAQLIQPLQENRDISKEPTSSWNRTHWERVINIAILDYITGNTPRAGKNDYGFLATSSQRGQMTSFGGIQTFPTAPYRPAADLSPVYELARQAPERIKSYVIQTLRMKTDGPRITAWIAALKKTGLGDDEIRGAVRRLHEVRDPTWTLLQGPTDQP